MKLSDFLCTSVVLLASAGILSTGASTDEFTAREEGDSAGDGWKQTLENGEAQRRLDENPLRRALLAFVR